MSYEVSTLGYTQRSNNDSGNNPGTENGANPNVAAGAALFFVTFATAGGNILVIAAVLSWRKLKKKFSSWFITSLATSDVLVAFLVMIWNAVSLSLGYWPFAWFCKIHHALDIMMSTASILNLCVIAVDRYWAVMFPFSYQEKMTKRRALVMIASAWIVSAVLSFVPVLTGIYTVPLEEGEIDPIELDPPICDFILNRYYAVVSSCISFYIPSATMILIYMRIYMEARRQQRIISHQNRPLNSDQKGEHKAAKTLGLILGVFIFCWLPFFVVNCIKPFCPDCVSNEVFVVVLWLGWVNSMMNPLLYATNREFRTAFQRLLCYKSYLRDRRLEYSNTTGYRYDTSCSMDGNQNKRKIVKRLLERNGGPNGKLGPHLDSPTTLRALHDISGADESSRDEFDQEENIPLQDGVTRTRNGENGYKS
ncbi:D(1)-like dopamine receptor [Holothuria leucospilota]|uniref:D(1)-like dopamine receptor n=1 Tax=Holothuria leucospilota TaxID=206669 RepID=A0A9Q0YSN0_HOLLE|nr:D(1)-like dopamine receptor [Holothuria leucospilota]